MDKVEISVELAKRLIAGNAGKGANAIQIADAWSAMEELEDILKSPTPTTERDLLEALEDLLKGAGSSPGANRKYAKARSAIARALRSNTDAQA